MRTSSSLHLVQWVLTIAAFAANAAPGAVLLAQDPARPPVVTGPQLTLMEALALARGLSPELTAARAAATAAAARERQAGVFPNPIISYQREQTSGNGGTNSQDIASVDQPIELGGLRSARVEAAQLRREAADVRVQGAGAQLDFDVTRAFALAGAADRRAALAQAAANAFARARNVSETRLVQGDVSGYANRRIRLEAARYAGLLAEAMLAQRAARLSLASLITVSGDSLHHGELVLADSLGVAAPALAPDSLRALASSHRAELRVATLEAEAAAADARLVRRERIPVPTVSAGLKNDRVSGGESSNGFVAGISLPVALWDRRRGAIDAAGAEALRSVAEADVVRRRILAEVNDAAANLRAVDEQLAILRPHLGAESDVALRAAQVAYSEGEITLVEWLDAVRAYQEAESTFALLRAESLIRRAALERAVGVPLSRDSR